jgi:hypothetical protein
MSDENRKGDDAPPKSASSTESAAAKPRRKLVGRPWVKGQSGNPAGRKPVLAEIRQKYLDNVDGLLAAILLSAHSSLKSGKTAAGVAAAHEFLDRITGKAPQPIVGEDGGAPINVNAPDLVAALRRLASSNDGEDG